MSNEVTIKIKVGAFFKSQGMCHVSLIGGGWYNGCVQELSDDFFMLHDREDGLLPIFYNEVESIENYIFRGNDGTGRPK